MQDSALSDIEAAVVQRMKKVQRRNPPDSGLLLVKKQCFASQVNHDIDFTCNSGLLAGLKAQHGIKAWVVSCKAAAADTVGAHDWKNGNKQQYVVQGELIGELRGKLGTFQKAVINARLPQH